MGNGNITQESCGVVTLFHVPEGSDVYYVDLVLIIFNSFSSLSSLILNIVWMRTLIYTRGKMSSSTVLLLALACTDIVVCTIVQPLFIVSQISQILPYFNSSCTVRHLYNFSGYVSAGFLLILLAIMASDRVAAVLLVGKYKEIVTRQRYISLLTVICIYVILVSALYSASLVTKVVFLTYLAISLALCLIIITACYCYLAYFLIMRRNRVRSGSGHSVREFRSTINKAKSKAESLANRRRMITIFILVGVAVLCYIPQGIMLLVRSFVDAKSSLIFSLDSIADSLAFLIGTINPLCYLFRRRKKFKEAVVSYRST